LVSLQGGYIGIVKYLENIKTAQKKTNNCNMPNRTQDCLRQDLLSSVDVMRAKRDINHAAKKFSTLRNNLQKACEIFFTKLAAKNRILNGLS
jgi:hypothetical protein